MANTKIIMRLTKKFDASRGEGLFLSHCIDTSLKAVEHLSIDRVEITFGEGELILPGRICIRKGNVFLSSRDAFGMRALLIRSLYKMEEEKNGLGDFVEDIMAAKKMIKDGLGEFVFHYYYVWLGTHRREIENIREFLSVNVPWIVFRHDESGRDFFKRVLRTFEYDRHYDAVCERLFALSCMETYTKAKIDALAAEYQSVL